MSNIFKEDEIGQIPIKPYLLEEVTRADSEKSDSAVFERLNEPKNDVDGSSESRTPEEVEAEQPDRERIDQIEREAYEKAFRLGEKAGAERGEQIFRSAVQTFVEAVDELKKIQREFYQRVEGEILGLVLATTRKVVQREVDSQKDVILHVLREAIVKSIDREKIRVRINPSDFDFVQAQKGDILKAIDGIKHLSIERDEAISRGGAIVESDYGTIDARIERRLEEVEKALKRQMATKKRTTMDEKTEPKEEEPEV